MKKTILSFFATIITIGVLNAQAPLRTKHFNVENEIAIQGYDAVAYFNQSKAVKGNKQYAATFEGITYNFSSAANKDLFVKDPKKYEPQYGGWCAYAMGASGEKVEIDPETFKIKTGKLYLFYHSWVNNTLTKWNKDEVNLNIKADKSWSFFFH